MTLIDLVSCLAAIPDRRRAEGKMYNQVGVIMVAAFLDLIVPAIRTDLFYATM